MRTVTGLGVLLLLLLPGLGCDSDQPLQAGQQVADITFNAPGGTVPSYYVWTVFEDRNGNLIADDDTDNDGEPDSGLVCSFADIDVNPSSTPWPFSVEVSVLRAGDTEAEVVAVSTSGAGNLPEYDDLSQTGFPRSPLTISHRLGKCVGDTAIICDPLEPFTTTCLNREAGICKEFGTCSSDPGIECALGFDPTLVCGLGTTCDPILPTPMIDRNFVFTNPRRLSAAHSEVLRSETNPLYELRPDDSCREFDAGVCFGGTCSADPARACDPARFDICPGFDFGDPSVAGVPQPFSVVLDKGDTVVVKARLLFSAFLGINASVPPGLVSRLTVDGAPVEAQGELSQPQSDPGPGIHYFFSSE